MSKLHNIPGNQGSLKSNLNGCFSLYSPLFGEDRNEIESLARINKLKDQNYKNSLKNLDSCENLLSYSSNFVRYNQKNLINSLQISIENVIFSLVSWSYFKNISARMVSSFARIKVFLTSKVLTNNYLFFPDSGIYSLNEQRVSS